MKNESAVDIFARGKLLLTGEYAVLDGAPSLALPVLSGQPLQASVTNQMGKLFWESLNSRGKSWFQAVFSVPDLFVLQASSAGTGETLQQLLQACRRQNPEFLKAPDGLRVRTQTDFPRTWGLGTSSTLIAALARWADVDPYEVLFETLGGSGYDIACAFAEGPLLYRLEGEKPIVEPVEFFPDFADRLFFIFLEKKQNSRDAIRRYRELTTDKAGLIETISKLTRQCLEARTLTDFSAVLLEHEQAISRALALPRAQDLYFPDFPGVVKSLGAWGGDFVLAASTLEPAETRAYFSG